MRQTDSPTPRTRAALLTCLLCLGWIPAPADVIVTEGSELHIDVSPERASIAVDLLGRIWTMPLRGGQAKLLLAEAFPAKRPRWSPDGKSILYESDTPQGARLKVYDLETRAVSALSAGQFHDQDGAWHPGGERIVFASDRNSTGLDLWERDLATGLEWRISDRPGDETEPAWSASGRHLVYVHHEAGRHAIVLRRHGEPEQQLAASIDPLSGPAWRPDGSLVTFLQQESDGTSLQMAILSEPVLLREIVGSKRGITGAVSWTDRMHLYYPTADGIRLRGFEDRQSRPVHFRAILDTPAARTPTPVVRKSLEISNAPEGRLVIRAARLFDGIWRGYRRDMDIVMSNGRIEAIETARDRDDVTLIDLGDVTVMPGLIDSWSAMPATMSGGAAVLAYGVTAIVAEPHGGVDASTWHGEDHPGPRLLPAITVQDDAVAPDSHYFMALLSAGAGDAEVMRARAAAWRAAGVPVAAESSSSAALFGADFVMGAAVQAADSGLMPAGEEATLVSALADAGNAGVVALTKARQAMELDQQAMPVRRFSSTPRLPPGMPVVVAGSRRNQLPEGLALHAELRALAAAGMDGEEVLHAAGRNAARVLGLENQIGTLTPGALADLVLVAGDPLANPAEAVKIVAVVRNGRFFSLVRLLELGKANGGVE